MKKSKVVNGIIKFLFLTLYTIIVVPLFVFSLEAKKDKKLVSAINTGFVFENICPIKPKMLHLQKFFPRQQYSFFLQN